MRTRHVSIVAAAVAIPTLALSPCQATPPGTVMYHLSPPSSLQQGCFNLCLCPIFYADGLTGSFDLTPMDITGTIDTYEVSNVNWQIEYGVNDEQITGSGTYTIVHGELTQHQMALELSINGSDPLTWDSGLAHTNTEFPHIDISMNRNNLECWDKVYAVSSGPVSMDTNDDDMINVDDLLNVILDYGTDGTVHRGDVNASGWTDVDDIVTVLLNWGPYTG